MATDRELGAHVLGVGGASNVGATERPTGIPALDYIIDRAIASTRVVGAVVAVAHRGQLVYLRAAGLADRETGRAMTVDTPFRLASVTKLFTTATALRMIEVGCLDPSQPVADLLPVFRPSLPDGSVPVITIDHLMSHTAGLDYGFQQPDGGPYARAGVSDGLDRAGISLSENVARIASVALDRRPGSSWRYSVATDVLGAAIEHATGLSLPEAVNTYLAEPLGLDSPTFQCEPSSLAVPYTDGEPLPRRMNGRTLFTMPPFAGGGVVIFDPDRIADPASFASGGAGMTAATCDVLTLLEALRNGAFISPRARAAARQARIGSEAQTQGPGWGYSWLGSILIDPIAAGVEFSAGTISLGGVYGHSWTVDFERDLIVLVMTNTAIEGMIGQFPRDVTSAAAKHFASPGTLEV